VPGLEERLVVLSPHLHDGVALSVAARRAGVSVADGPPVVGVYRADGSAGLSRSGRADDGDWRIAARVGGIGEGVGAAASVAEDRRGPPQDLRACRGAGSAGTVVSVVSVVSVGSAGSLRSLDRGLLAVADHDADVYRDDFDWCCAGIVARQRY